MKSNLNLDINLNQKKEKCSIGGEAIAVFNRDMKSVLSADVVRDMLDKTDGGGGGRGCCYCRSTVSCQPSATVVYIRTGPERPW